MYYFYCRNGYIYHDSFLGVISRSERSLNPGVKEGDVVTMFVDHHKWQLIWYVNNQYAGLHFIDHEHRGNMTRLFPFLELTSRGDEVSLLS